MSLLMQALLASPLGYACWLFPLVMAVGVWVHSNTRN